MREKKPRECGLGVGRGRVQCTVLHLSPPAPQGHHSACMLVMARFAEAQVISVASFRAVQTIGVWGRWRVGVVV